MNSSEYFINKLPALKGKIESLKKEIISTFVETTPKDAVKRAERLESLCNIYNEISNDACKYDTFDNIVIMLNADVIDKYTVASYFKYTEVVTIEQRDILKKISYMFNDVKVK
jgi:hypothetical protein